MDKPEKPNAELPNSFGGIKEPFSTDRIKNGFEPNVPQIFEGGNLNDWLDKTGKKFEYIGKIADFVNGLPIDNIITTDINNKLIYINKLELSGANIDLANLSVDGEKRFDNKANIDLLNTAPGQAFKDESMSWIMPDYTKGINKAVGVAHTADKNGWIVVRGYLNGYGTASRFLINGEMVVYTSVGDGGGDSFIPAPVAKGDTYILVQGTSMIFYPAKGEI